MVWRYTTHNNKLLSFEIRYKNRLVKKFAVYSGERLFIVIGNSKEHAHVVVGSSALSGRYLAVIKDEKDRIFVELLNEKGIVLLNGSRLSTGSRQLIKAGDEVILTADGNLRMFVRLPVERSVNTGMGAVAGTGKRQICIGRSKGCDYVIASDFASARHAFLIEEDTGKYILKDNHSLNGTYVNGKLISMPVPVTNTDRITIGDHHFTLSDVLRGSSRTGEKPQANISSKISVALSRKGRVLIGRSSKADYRINDFSVSRKHALITKESGRVFIEDLGSKNGTYVNGRRIKGKVEIGPRDEIRISFEVFRLDGVVKRLDYYSAVRAEGVMKKIQVGGKEFITVLNPLSVSIPSRGFVALMGPSGCGKSTLLKILSGNFQPTSGEVFIHGLNLSEHLDLIKQKVGYVPQDDIVHNQLTVEDALFYAAKLRMSEELSDKEINQRIDEVCNQLKIDGAKRKRKIKDLSGGERKRVSIAVELLNKPSILFLDEPTSPLDPETIDSFLQALKSLTERTGTTIIMVTHKPSDLAYIDRVIFLGAGGYLTYYGSVKGLFEFFGTRNISKIYASLSNESSARQWYYKWMDHKKANARPRVERKMTKEPRQFSYVRQFYWLARRYAHIKWNDRQSLALLILQPLIIPLALVFIYNKLELGILFLMAITSIWFGVSNAAKEIVDELAIFKRERMYNLSVIPYLFSKLAVLGLIAIVQSFLFVSIVYWAYSNDSVSLNHPVKSFGVLFTLTFSATLMGLMLSSMFRNSESVMSIIPIVLIPQIIFAGVITSIDSRGKEILSYLMHGRWGTELLARIQRDDPYSKSFRFGLNDTLLIKINESGKVDSGLVYFGNGFYKQSVAGVMNSNGYNTKAIHRKPEYKTVYQQVPNILRLKDTLLYVGNKKKNDDEIRVYNNRGNYVFAKSIVYEDGMKYVKKDPLKLLGYYENEKLMNFFNGSGKNLGVIFFLDAVFLLITIVKLRQKEKL